MSTTFNRKLLNDTNPTLAANLQMNGNSIAFPLATISDTLISTALAGASNGTLASSLAIKTYVDDGLALKLDASQKGAANGVATLDAGGKIPSAQLPAIALTEVFVVADITARDALTVQEGDVAKVTDASADPAVTSGSASYIYDGAAWVRLNVDDQVLSVNGQTGSVSLDADDIDDSATTNKFATAAELADIAANTAARHDAMTLNAGAATQESASLTGQELTLNQATGSTDGVMSSEDKTKLDGIEAGATADQTGAEIKLAYEAEADTNAYTDAEKAKLAGIESGATADQSAAEVPYSNTTSGLTATDAQGAIDEVEGRLDTAESNISANTAAIAAITDSNQVSLNQVAHGLAVGDLVYISGSNTVTKSQANAEANAEVNAIVTSVADVDNFTMAVNGVQTLTGATLTPGSDYFLSAGTAGAYTTTAPSTTGQVDKPCFRALTTTQIVFAPQRGIVID